jgi:hypothetical protein
MDLMKPPETRAEFERRFFLLREQIMRGKMSFPSDIKMSELGLLQVRQLPNGRIDFLSVNEMARLTANMMDHMPSHVESEDTEGGAENGQVETARSKGVAEKRARRKEAVKNKARTKAGAKKKARTRRAGKKKVLKKGAGKKKARRKGAAEKRARSKGSKKIHRKKRK